jgi:hypothetical protein
MKQFQIGGIGRQPSETPVPTKRKGGVCGPARRVELRPLFAINDYVQFIDGRFSI